MYLYKLGLFIVENFGLSISCFSSTQNIYTMTGLVVEKLKFYEYRFVIGWIGAVDIIIHILIVKNFHITFV